MGKSGLESVKAMERILKNLRKSEESKIAGFINNKPLMKEIKDSEGRLVDGELLFGKHQGELISDLIDGFITNSYVVNYLMGSENLPEDFRNRVREIIEGMDPNPEKLDSPLSKSPTVREIGPIDWGDDEIPW